MTGFLLGLCFGTGFALLWFGVTRTQSPKPRRRLVEPLLQDAHVALDPTIFVLLATTAAVLAGWLVWSLTGIAVLSLVAAGAAGYGPVACARTRRDRHRRERDRSWPAAVAQLADALEAGIAFPAAVALVAQSGPVPLRGDFQAFLGRLRTGGLEAALDGLSGDRDETAGTVALLLRAGLLDLPSGGVAPALRELAQVLAQRFDAREKARSRAQSLQTEAAVLAVSPVVLLGIIGLVSPAYLEAYRTAGGTVVGALGAVAIAGCYVLMRRMGRIPEARRNAGRQV